MDELFFENFLKPKQSAAHAVEVRLKETKLEPVMGSLETSPSQGSEPTIDMLIFLDRLEREIEKEYRDFADYRFIFSKIRAELKKRSVNGVLELLDQLEELLDLGLPLCSGK